MICRTSTESEASFSESGFPRRNGNPQPVWNHQRRSNGHLPELPRTLTRGEEGESKFNLKVVLERWQYR